MYWRVHHRSTLIVLNSENFTLNSFLIPILKAKMDKIDKKIIAFAANRSKSYKLGATGQMSNLFLEDLIDIQRLKNLINHNSHIT